MKLLQDRLQLEVEEHIKKMKKIHHDYINAPQAKIATNQQVVSLKIYLVDQEWNNMVGSFNLIVIRLIVTW